MSMRPKWSSTRLHERLGRCGVRQVGLERHAALPPMASAVSVGFAAVAVHGHGRTRGSQTLGDGGAESAGGSSDQGDFAV